jgi:hypothetical protein
MSLIAPLNFLFAGLIGLVVLLYFLRLKRKERVVSSTILWQSALRDLQANAPWQKLRSSLLMWLQIAFLALAVFALARPAIKVLAANGQRIAIIIDASGSMGATDVRPSRFEQARAEAGRLINALSSGDSATLITAGAQTRVLAPLTTNKNVLKRALSGARYEDTTCNLREAIVLANSLLHGAKKSGQIYVLSDGAVEPITDLSVGDVGVQFVRFGRGSNNLGITAMDVRRGYGSDTNAQIFVTVQNFSAKERSINLELSHDGDLIKVRPVTVPSKGQASELFNDTQFQQGLFGVRFDGDDDLASDDVAYASLEAPQNIKVLLISDGNRFLEKALAVDPSVQSVKSTRADFATLKSTGDYDVVICDGPPPPNLPATNQLVFNAVTDLTPVTKIGVISQPSVADWDHKHPVVRYAPWNDVRFGEVMAVQLKPWGQSIVDGERSPLVVAGEKGGHRVVWCAFDMQETDLGLRVAFPIFISSALHWLATPQGSTATTGSPNRAGSPVPLAVPPGMRDVTVTGADKVTHRLTVESTPVLFHDADRVGVYTATAQNGKTQWRQQFGVSLLNKAESDLQPRQNLQIGSGKAVSGETRARANKELWGYLALLALVLLGAEWWVYHRGI